MSRTGFVRESFNSDSGYDNNDVCTPVDRLLVFGEDGGCRSGQRGITSPVNMTVRTVSGGGSKVVVVTWGMGERLRRSYE